jgi:hypothetical protein
MPKGKVQMKSKVQILDPVERCFDIKSFGIDLTFGF